MNCPFRQGRPSLNGKYLRATFSDCSLDLAQDGSMGRGETFKVRPLQLLSIAESPGM